MKVYVIQEWVEEDFGGYHLAYHSVTADHSVAEGYKYCDDYEIEEVEL